MKSPKLPYIKNKQERSVLSIRLLHAMVRKVCTCMDVAPVTSEPHCYWVLRDYKQQKLCVCRFLLQSALFGPKKCENYERKMMSFMSKGILLFDHL